MQLFQNNVTRMIDEMKTVLSGEHLNENDIDWLITKANSAHHLASTVTSIHDTYEPVLDSAKNFY